MGKLVCVALVVGAFALGVFVGRMPIMSLILDDAAPASQTAPKTTNTTPTSEPTGGTVISTANLSDGQQKLLSTLGIDASKITVTPAMIACAEAKVGAARIAEITGGATPSFTEGLSLLACYK